MRLQGWWRRATSDGRDLDTRHYMGGPRSGSCRLDCYKTLPWTATTIYRMDHRGLFHGVNQDPHTLFCSVSGWCGYDDLSVELLYVLALLLFLASTLVSCLQRSWYAGLCDSSAFEHSCFNRTHLPLELRFIAAFFNLSHSCRCLWWDHASSLAFENITLSWWPTPRKELA